MNAWKQVANMLPKNAKFVVISRDPYHCYVVNVEVSDLPEGISSAINKVTTLKTITGAGFAKRNPTDEPNENLGVSIAKGRAVKDACRQLIHLIGMTRATIQPPKPKKDLIGRLADIAEDKLNGEQESLDEMLSDL